MKRTSSSGIAAGGGVPHDDALGGADAADIRVKAVGLDAGLHQIHAVGRNVGPGAGHHFFQFRDQRGITFGQRLEFVEDGFEQRRYKDAETPGAGVVATQSPSQ